jgi:hypothetical protein
MSALVALLGADILAVGGEAVSGRELLAAGVVSGRWQRLEHELADGLALVAADAPAKDEIRAEVRAFRVERRLLSAEDLRAWMAPRELTMAALNGFAARAVARRRGGTRGTAAATDVAAALPAEAICGGVLRELGGWLADRRLAADAAEAPVAAPALDDPRVARLVAEEERTVAGASLQEPAQARAARLAHIVALDDAHREWQAGVTHDRAVARLLRERELDWCRFELDELRLTSAGAAAEAASQLAEGRPAPDVASAAGVAVQSQRLLLADAPARHAASLAGAGTGSVVGPWADGEQHVVLRVRERHAPRAGDAQLLVRARDELTAEASARLRAGKVRWHERA